MSPVAVNSNPLNAQPWTSSLSFVGVSFYVLRYASSIGFLLALGCLVPAKLPRFRTATSPSQASPSSAAWRIPKRHVAVLTVLAVASMLYTARTWVRNYDWNNEADLFEAGIRMAPRSVKALNNRAMLLVDAKTQEEVLPGAWYNVRSALHTSLFCVLLDRFAAASIRRGTVEPIPHHSSPLQLGILQSRYYDVHHHGTAPSSTKLPPCLLPSFRVHDSHDRPQSRPA